MWSLIIVVFATSSVASATVTTLEFSTEQLCQMAGFVFGECHFRGLTRLRSLMGCYSSRCRNGHCNTVKTQVAPKDAGWIRWSGAFLIGIALAAWLAATQPDRQRALVIGLALSYLLVALSLLYTTVSGEYQGNAMVHLDAHRYQSCFDGWNDLADH
jgi:hypothetical protein